MSLFVEDEEKSDKPCWVGFSGEGDTIGKIPMTYAEEEAAKWILMGWDVGFLPEGTNNALNVKWLT